MNQMNRHGLWHKVFFFFQGLFECSNRVRQSKRAVNKIALWVYHEIDRHRANSQLLSDKWIVTFAE